MGKLSASLVVSLNDRTGAGARGVKKSLNDIQRAERDLEMSRRGRRRLRGVPADEAAQLARERQTRQQDADRQRDTADRQRRAGVFFGGLTMAATAAGYAAARAYSNFADVERKIGRIALNADKGLDIVGPTMTKLQQLAQKTALSFDDVSSGLETLVASGRSLDDSMAFLPSVAMTAQASGAAISDIALSADALSGSMKIGAADMQKAFDILVAGGKAGKFELRDMAQYLPSLLPAFSALGYEGTEGLQKIVAMLQVVRNQAGSSAEAATYLGNVFQKMYSEETAKKFKKFGVDLPKALDRARREGKDVLDVFLDMTALATKGDLSKLTQIFTDAEVQKGVRALMMGRPDLEKYTRELSNVDGSALRDFNKIAEDSAGKIQRLSTLWGTFMAQLGGKVADGANPVLEKLTTAISDAEARAKSRKEQGDFRANNRKEFDRRYRQLDPEKYDIQRNRFAQALLDEKFREAETQHGKGEWKTVFDEVDNALRSKEARQQYLDGKAKPSTGRQNLTRMGTTRYPNAVDRDGVVKDKKGGRYSRYTDDVPLPEARPTAESEAEERRQDAYRHGTGRQYVTDDAVKKARDWSRKTWQSLTREERRRRLREADPRQLGMDGMFGVEMEEQRSGSGGDGGRVTVPEGGAADSMTPGAGQPSGGVLDQLDQSKPVMENRPSEVSIKGDVVTRPSGIQQVQVTNPSPVHAPINVGGVTVHVSSNADPAAIGQQVADQVGRKVKEELAGVYANTNWTVS